MKALWKLTPSGIHSTSICQEPTRSGHSASFSEYCGEQYKMIFSWDRRSIMEKYDEKCSVQFQEGVLSLKQKRVTGWR